MHHPKKGKNKIILGLLIVLCWLAPVSFAQSSGVISASPPAQDFGGAVERVQQVTRLIEVRNTGTANLTVSQLSMAGTYAADFWFTAEWPFTLAPGADRQIIVTFAPSSTGLKTALLRIASNASNQPQLDVPLSGVGLPLAGLGQIVASANPGNTVPQAGDLITVEVRINANGANPPANLVRAYEASLTWNPAVLTFSGFTLGDSPWHSPASIGQDNGVVNWFDAVGGGVGGSLAIIRLKFNVIGAAGSSSNLNLSFSRLEGEGIENLLPILIVNSSSITVNAATAPPDIDVSPPAHNYGSVPLSGNVAQTFLVRNLGRQTLNVTATTLGGLTAGQFRIDSGGAPFSLAPGASRQLVVSCRPTTTGVKLAALTLRSNDPDEPAFAVPLSASVSMPDIAVTPASLNFGDAPLGATVARTLTISNTGNGTLLLSQFGLDGHQSQFAYNTGSLVFLPPGQSANITVYFTPTTTGAKSATFVIHSNDPDEITTAIPLTGRGIN